MKLGDVKSKWRRWLRLIQVTVTVGLALWLLRKVEWSAVQPLLADLQWRLVLFAIGALLCSHLLNIARWRYLLQEPSVGFYTLLVLYGAGLFANNFLPSGIGGDGVRAALLARSTSIRRATLSVGVDRLIGLVALSVLFGIGIWLGVPHYLLASYNRLLAIATDRSLPWYLAAIVFGAGVCAVGWRRLPQVRTRLLQLTRLDKLSSTVAYPTRRLLILLSAAYLYSVMSHLLLVAAYWLALGSLNIDVSLGTVVWLLLSVSISLLAPITVNGLGLQESIFIMVLGGYGVAPTQALAAALLIRLLGLFFSVLGGLLMLFWNRSHSTEIGGAYERTS
jgi:glycosyltransferase 2 family protein